MEGPRRHGSLVGPMILIGLGVVFLLNNLGRLDWSIWEMILRLWPVLIIGIGLELLIGRRSVWGSLLVALLLIVVLAGAVYLYRSPAATPSFTTQSVSQSLDGATRGEVTVDSGVGRLNVDAGADGDWLVQGTVSLGRGERLHSEGRVAGGVAHYQISSEGLQASWFSGRIGERREWNLSLTPTVPLDLTLRSGVGEAVMDLTGLEVTDLEVTSGVGRVSVTLPAEGRIRVTIQGGVGEIVLTLPAEMAARIQVDVGLTQVSVPGGFVHEGDVYRSPNYNVAENRADIEIDGGLGRILVVQGP